jgi:hypothetical protein
MGNEDDRPNPSEAATTMAQALVQLGAMLEPLMESVTGYRTSVMALGFDEEAAMRMAADYHKLLIAVLAKNMGAR